MELQHNKYESNHNLSRIKTAIAPSSLRIGPPLTENIDNIKQMEDAGAAEVVLHSIFEEQLRLEEYELHHHLSYGTESFAEALTYFPEPETFHVGGEEYLKPYLCLYTSIKHNA